MNTTLGVALVTAVVTAITVSWAVPPAAAQTPYVGEIITFAGTFCPQGFAAADGGLQSIGDNPAMYNLLGTTFGGDGQNTFAVPNLQGATVVGTGQGVGLPNIVIGQTGGNTNTANVQPAIAKSVQVPATQSPFLTITPCVSLFGVYPQPP